MTLTYASTLDLPDEWFAALASAAGDVEILRPGGEPDGWPEAVRSRVDVLHTTDGGFDPAGFPDLDLVQLDTSGVDHVVGSPLWATGIPLVTLGGVAPIPMAEYALLGLLSLAHHLPALLAARADRTWLPPGERLARYTPTALPGSTVCIVGYGRIGREIARLCRTFGMHAIGVRRTTASSPIPAFDLGRSGDAPDETEIVALDRLDEALGRADFVVVVLPLTAATRGLFDGTRLDAMRPGAGLVDIGRGGIVDGTALLERVRSGRISGAVLDVFDTEPLPPESPWWDEPRVLMTPHIAGLAPAYLAGTRDLLLENLRRLAAGDPLMNEVDRARGY